MTRRPKKPRTKAPAKRKPVPKRKAAPRRRASAPPPAGTSPSPALAPAPATPPPTPTTTPAPAPLYTPRGRGRRSLLEVTPEVADILCTLIAGGMPILHAAAEAGIHPSSCFEWVQKGEKPDADPIYSEFAERIAQARATKVRRLLADIEQAGSIPNLITGQVDWKAKAWILERTEPDTFRAPTQRTELTGKDGKPIQHEGTMADVLRIALAQPETPPMGATETMGQLPESAPLPEGAKAEEPAS